MPKEKTHDVHTSVGLWFIAGCVLLGLFFGAVVPISTDRLGLVHLGSAAAGVQHIHSKDVLVFGLVCALFGMISGILLAINRNLWWVGGLVAVAPCGIFGGCAAMVTPHPYPPAANALMYWSIPLLITGSCVLLRREVWKRHERPLKKSSDGSG